MPKIMILALLAGCTATPAGSDCVPQCNGNRVRNCGPDDCGGSCGTCPAGASCGSDFRCIATDVPQCVPYCKGSACGAPDGCGSNCPPNSGCVYSGCKPCVCPGCAAGASYASCLRELGNCQGRCAQIAAACCAAYVGQYPADSCE